MRSLGPLANAVRSSRLPALGGDPGRIGNPLYEIGVCSAKVHSREECPHENGFSGDNDCNLVAFDPNSIFSNCPGQPNQTRQVRLKGNVPESMRIQQQVTKKDLADPKALITKGGAATTDAPGAARSPIESNRLDPAAPSRQRLQIDEGASARAVQNPGANGANPGNTTGNSFNTVIEGSPSNNGTSTGVSGTAPSSTSGALTSPSGSVTPSVSPSGTSGTSAAERRALLVARPPAADQQAVVLPAVAAVATRLQAARLVGNRFLGAEQAPS